MEAYDSYLQWVESQQQPMEELLIHWSNINSGSENNSGLIKMIELIKNETESLQATIQEIPLLPRTGINPEGKKIEFPLAPALSIKKRPEAPIQVLLAGHFDTVFPLNSPFQKAIRISSSRICGPGVADMKGGLIVMIKAIQALERSPFASQIGWEMFFNPDEEIGSPGSAIHYSQKAKKYDLGLIFEPAFPDGQLVSWRKGSSNYTFITRGRAAHSGRNFHEGRNAIVRMAKLALALDKLNACTDPFIVNVGTMHGGTASNIVPDLAITQVSCRFNKPEKMQELDQLMQNLTADHSDEEVQCELFKNSGRPPKLMNGPTEELFGCFQDCALKLKGSALEWKPSGGVSDGNFLANEGLPTIDTLGVVGGNIHTFEEYLEVESLSARASLTLLFLMRLASGDLKVSKRRHANE